MKHNFKRGLSWLMALALLLALLPGAVRTAYAAGEVADVDGTTYTDIDAALDALSSGGSKLTLLDDAAANSYAYINGGAKTIDLNGHTLSASNFTVAMLGGSLTVKDSVGNGSIVSSGGYDIPVYIGGGSFTLESGTIGDNSGTYGIYVPEYGAGTIDLKGGNILCGSVDGNFAVYCSEHSSAAITVEGTAVVGSETAYYGVYTIGDGSVTVKGGTVLAKEYALVAYDGTVSIEGGTIESKTANDASAVQIAADAACTMSGGKILSTGNGIYVSDFDANVTGTTGKTLSVTGGEIDAAHKGIASNGSNEEIITINISGDAKIHGDQTALFVPNRGETVNISDNAELTGGTGIVVKGGTVNISGGTIKGTDPSAVAQTQGSGFISTGDALFVEDTYYDKNLGAVYAPIVTITGGTFTSEHGYAMQYYTDEAHKANAVGYIEASNGTFSSPQATSEYNNSTLDDKIIISGGKYDKEPDPADIEPGKIAVQTTDGKWTVGTSYFQGYSLSLKGDIAINCFISLGEGDLALNAANTTVELSYLNNTDTYDLSTQSVDAATGWYKFSARFAAKEMTETVTATLKQSGTVIEQKTFSIAGYASSIVANEGGKFSTLANFDKLQPLCRAMIIYGAKAQAQFDYKTDALADASLGAYTLDAVDADALPAYPAAVDLSAFGITFTESSLLLESKTTHRLYFTVEDADKLGAATIKCGSKALTAVVSGSTAYIDIPDIASRNVLKNYTVTFTNGSDTAKLKLNASSYIKNALATNDDTLKDTVTALYWYSTAAEAYFSAN